MSRAVIALALVAAAHATATSTKTCEQLGWTAAGINDKAGGSRACGASWCAQDGSDTPYLSNTAKSRREAGGNPNVNRNPSALEKVIFTKALEICSTAGARLCTQRELESDEARGSGCNLNWGRVWSSTECPSSNASAVEAVYTMQGSMAHMTDQKTSHETTCTDKADDEKHFVRCCADWGVVSVPKHLTKLGVKNFADHATHHKSHFDSLQASDTTASHNATDDTWKPHIGERVKGFERCCNARDHTHGSIHTTCSLVTESHFDTETAKNVSHDMIKIKHKLGVAESRKTDEYNCQPDGSMVSGCRCCECINGAAVEENGQHASQVVLQMPTCRDQHNKVPTCKESTTICHHDKDGNELVYNPAPHVQKCQKCGDRHGRLACPKTGCSSKGPEPDFKSLALNTIPGANAEGKCMHCGGKNEIPCAGDQCKDGFALSDNGLKCKTIPV